ncbi:SKP1-interacting partner 15-like [Punica granatum]|uniref:SKP1-interacting partner 15-like n=2 Tax=Punica granatum TaxID=22663 RepID=A0A6P8DPV5_PUNGR|nr:SKP1-interacting partner 15-like [Punica granatum]XP_031393968.1 SKP1-interacting partner 15-like [Punica granatum]OWM85055.1 hypothetical protein CDL15_Pgr027842 [Punica granatum]PKI57451.1 hypothetical protein CRG98_022102 [Punica granatum]
MDAASAPIYNLPEDALLQIFSSLPLRQIIVCRSVSKFFYHLLTSPSFVHHLLIPSASLPLRLIALRPPHHHHHYRHTSRHSSLPQQSSSVLHAFDPCEDRWLGFSLGFLPFRSLHPVAASSLGLVYLWGDSVDSPESSRSLVACNPLTRQFKVLPHLGSAWSRHGSVLVDSENRVMVLTELAALYYTGSNRWLKFSSNLPSKPRSPVLVSDSAYALCDIGSPWRSQWKLFSCSLKTSHSSSSTHHWVRLERHEWGDVFDILKRPRLVKGGAEDQILMVGGLKSSFSLNASCSTILILRLDLGTLEWDEAGRMPVEMFRCFSEESSKFKVFGGGNRVCFSGKRVGRLALWDYCDGKSEWRWIDEVPAFGDGFCRGFVFGAALTALS